MRINGYLLSFLLLLAGITYAQESPAPATPESSAKGVHQGRLIHKVAPVYPPEAKAQRAEGTVELSAKIGKDGKLSDMKVVSGDPRLTKAALDAVAQWEYEPYRLNDQPVEVETSIKINFVLPPAPALYERSDPAPEPERPEGLAKRVRVSQGVTQGLIVKKVTPQYPPDAREAHIQGAVVFAVLIDYDGKMKTIRLVSGHPALFPAALDAVKRWEYKPYLLQGVPVQIDSQITVNFTLAPY